MLRWLKIKKECLYSERNILPYISASATVSKWVMLLTDLFSFLRADLSAFVFYSWKSWLCALLICKTVLSEGGHVFLHASFTLRTSHPYLKLSLSKLSLWPSFHFANWGLMISEFIYSLIYEKRLKKVSCVPGPE